MADIKYQEPQYWGGRNGEDPGLTSEPLILVKVLVSNSELNAS